MRRARGTLFNIYVAAWLGRRVLRLHRGLRPSDLRSQRRRRRRR
jgi:hypothetical protein